MMRTLILLAAALAASAASGATKIIHAGTLLAVPGQAPTERQTIVLKNNRIVEVRDGFLDPSSLPGSPEVIDLSGQFVMPGLMDMHVHITFEIAPDRREQALRLTTSMEALRGAHYALETLRAGFTTVRDLGGDPEAVFALRDSIRDGFVPGPRIVAAGSALAATGGHGDVSGYKPELLELWTPDTICDGPYDCRRAVRRAVKYGADWIKITATGGVLSDTGTGLGQQMTDDELAEIVATAHALGVRVAAHAHGTDGINAALEAGVDSIDHGTFLDRDSIRLLKNRNAYLVPTLSPAIKIPAAMAGNPFFTDAIREKANAASAAAVDRFRSAHEAGVRIAFGTDSAVTPHGDNADEFSMMVEAGMNEMDALRSATVVAAELIEQSDVLGTIETGKLADIVAFDGNPLEDIAVMKQVALVIKDGQIVR